MTSIKGSHWKVTLGDKGEGDQNSQKKRWRHLCTALTYIVGPDCLESTTYFWNNIKISVVIYSLLFLDNLQTAVLENSQFFARYLDK